MKRLFFMLLATISLIACDKGDNNTPQSIELTNDTQKEQTVYADDTQKPESIKFKALSDWTASVNEVSNRAADKDAWLKLSAYNGKAGDVALSLTITPNKTGADRKAEILISCGEVTITITIMQKSTNNPAPEEPEQPGAILFISADGKVKGGEIFGTPQPTALSWGVRCPDHYRRSTTTYPYLNKSFDITLPIPNANELGELLSAGANITISPADAKFAWGTIDFAEGLIMPSNRVKEQSDEAYDAKKGDGMVRFVYTSKSVTFNGTVTDEQKTYKFTNCQLRQGWNEMVMIAAQDAEADGSVVINVTANNVPADFKWVVVKEIDNPFDPEEPENPEEEVNYIQSKDHRQSISAFMFDSREAGVNGMYLDIWDNLLDKPILTLLLNKQGFPSAKEEGVYTFSNTPSSAPIFSVKRSTIGSIESGIVTIERITTPDEFGSGGSDEYTIVIEAKDLAGDPIKGVIKGGNSVSRVHGSGEMTYSYNNAKAEVREVVFDGFGVASGNFALNFYKENWSGRQSLAFDMRVSFNKENLNTSDLSGVYTFSDAALTPGKFNLQKGMAGDAVYYVQSGTIKIEHTQQYKPDGNYKITVDLNTTLDGEGLENPSKVTGVYTGYISDITR